MAPYMPFLYVKDNRKVIDFCLFHKQKIKNTPTKLHCKPKQMERYYFITFAIRVIIGYFEIGESRFVP